MLPETDRGVNGATPKPVPTDRPESTAIELAYALAARTPISGFYVDPVPGGWSVGETLGYVDSDYERSELAFAPTLAGALRAALARVRAMSE
jgi:hypothetical protein